MKEPPLSAFDRGRQAASAAFAEAQAAGKGRATVQCPFKAGRKKEAFWMGVECQRRTIATRPSNLIRLTKEQLTTLKEGVALAAAAARAIQSINPPKPLNP